MSYLKFKHVFAGLMGLSAVTAFVIPSRFVQGRKPAVEILFAPIARPSGSILRWAHDRFAPELSQDQRDAEVVRRENEALKNDMSNLRNRLADLQRINDERNQIDIRQLCTPYAVIGGDTGSRSSLAIQGSSLQGLRENMVALYSGGIAGRVQRAGIAGARIQLVTDVGFRVLGSFVRYDGAKFIQVKHPPTVIEGTGHGAMVIRSLTRDDVKASGLALGDWVTVSDRDWPKNLQGRGLGQIKAIGPRADAPLFWASITVEPPQNLTRLTEVMIVTKGGEE